MGEKKMTEKRLRAIVAAAKSPGYQFVVTTARGLLALSTIFIARDTRDPNSFVTIRAGGSIVPDTMTESDVLRLLLAQVKVLQSHEAEEWFRYKGQQIFNPHDPVVVNKRVHGARHPRTTG